MLQLPKFVDLQYDVEIKELMQNGAIRCAN